MKGKNKGIVILTYTGSPFKSLMLANLELLINFNVIVVENGKNSKYEQLGLEAGINTFNEFILLQDSVKIKDSSLFMEMLNNPKSVWLSKWGQNYFCKYKSDILKKIPINISNKSESVEMERKLHEEYRKYEEPEIILDGCLENTDIFEYKYGRNNMICENKYFKKYKGTWEVKMIKIDETIKNGGII